MIKINLKIFFQKKVGKAAAPAAAAPAAADKAAPAKKGGKKGEFKTSSD